MRAIHVVILAAAGRVIEFFSAHPLDNPAVPRLVERLAAKVADFRLLGQKEGDADKLRSRATRRRHVVARDIRQYLLRPINSFAAAAFRDDPARVSLYRLRAGAARTQEGFLIASRAILANVRENLAALTAEGMDPSLADELGQALDEYERLPVEVTSGKRTAAGARDGLETATDQIMDLLQHLDGIVRQQFRKEPELLREWQVVRNIPWPRYPRKQPAVKQPPLRPEGTEG